MGGIGSGRTAQHMTTGAAFGLDLASLRATGRRAGAWSWKREGNVVASVGWSLTPDALVLEYARSGMPCTERLPLVSITAGFGGCRSLLRCKCGRNCRVVYIGKRGAQCRQCSRLTYPSQRLSPADRTLYRASRLARRLGSDSQYPEPEFPEKPPRMHWQTYWKRSQQFEGMLALSDELRFAGAAKLWGRFNAAMGLSA